jgi:hypothetical protein
MQAKTHGNQYCKYMLSLILSCAILHGCASAPCAGARGELIARHELQPGELCKTTDTIRVEARSGLTGLWVGDTYFRVIVERNAAHTKGAASCGPVTDEELAATRASLMNMFKEIHLEELGRLRGMIDYETSMIAFQKEMTGILKMGTVTTRESGDGSCLSIFQVASKHARQLVHCAGNSGN